VIFEPLEAEYIFLFCGKKEFGKVICESKQSSLLQVV
jgi:hypothetical protein